MRASDSFHEQPGKLQHVGKVKMRANDSFREDAPSAQRGGQSTAETGGDGDGPLVLESLLSWNLWLIPTSSPLPLSR